MFKIGSENENGEHQRGDTGWPYSIYFEKTTSAAAMRCCATVSKTGTTPSSCSPSATPKSDPPSSPANQMFAWENA